MTRAPIRMVCGILMMHRGTSSPEPPYTLARGVPKAPLRSRGSLAPLALRKSVSKAPDPIENVHVHVPLRSRSGDGGPRHVAGAFAKPGPRFEIRPVVEARDPEHDADQDEEQQHGHGYDPRRQAERGRERCR